MRVGGARHASHVVGVHHDRVALDEARAAAVHDDRARPMLVERLAHLVAPDRVAGDVDAVDHPAGHRPERLADLAGAVPAARHRDPARARSATSREARVAELVGALGLREDRQVARQECRGCLVEVVARAGG